MTRRFLAVLTVTGALAAGAPGLAAADPGNEASGSLGTVQVGGTSVAPSAAATVTETADAAATAPTALAGSGGNTTDQSAGTVQVGGENSANEAAGTAQASGTSSEPQAGAEAAGTRVGASAPGSTSGDAHRADRSVGTVQAGGNDASGSATTIQVAPTAAAPSAAASDVMIGNVQAGPDRVDVALLANAAGRPRIGLDTGRGVDPRGIVLEPETATVQFASIGLDPEFAAMFDSLASLLASGSIEATPNDGESANGSLATGQAGGIAARPDVQLAADPVETTVTLGGSGNVSGSGTNSVSDSLGTVQAGGGDTANGSTGTIQVGATKLSPATSVASPAGTLVLGGSSGMGGEGASTASDSVGTVQIGGGNNADRSAGSVQSGPVEAAPAVTLSDTPTGEAVAVGGASGAGGSGNDASESNGTVQIGGGSDADDSAGTFQAGPVTLDPSLAVGGITADGGTTIGDGAGGNSATGSIGTFQVGGGNRVPRSIQTVQATGPAAAPATPSAESAPAARPAPAAAPPAAEQVAAENATRAGRRHAKRPRTGSRVQPSPPASIRPLGAELTATRTAATLPFTGLNLLLAALLGAALLGTGLGVRRLVPST